MIGYFLAVLVGLSLGLLGGGGSILTVPILVYIMNIPTKTAIPLSLAIVGITSIFGVMGHLKNKNIDFKLTALFGPISIFGTILGTQISSFVSGTLQLALFAIIMILASFFMYKGRSHLNNNSSNNEIKYFWVLIQGLIVGIITGLVGVGGGFLIVPALVLLTNTPMKKALGTSLLLISFNSFSGFLGYLNKTNIDWAFLMNFSLLSIVGILIGTKLVKYVPQEKLKKAFAIFLLIMGSFILYKNIF